MAGQEGHCPCSGKLWGQMNNLSVRTGFPSTPSPRSNHLFTPQATCVIANPSFSLHPVITTQKICAKPLLPFQAEGRSGQPCQGGLWGIVTAVFGFSWSRGLQVPGNMGWESIAGRKWSQTDLPPHWCVLVCRWCSCQPFFLC